MKHSTLLGSCLTLVLAASCGGGGGGGGGGGTPAPANVVYPTNPALYTVGFAIAPNIPSVDGTVTGWSISPSLPAGLAFDTATGGISGTPLAGLDTSDFTVTATNGGGMAVATFNLTVAQPGPRAAYVANTGDSTVLSYHVGSLVHTDYDVSPGSGARALVSSPDGNFVFLANNVTDDITTFAADTLRGRLTDTGLSASAGAQPTDLAVDPTGSFLYAANSGDDTVSVFTINPGTGELTPGIAAGTGSSPVALLIDPTGQFLYVANSGSNDIELFSIHPITGELTATASVPAGDSPQGLTWATTTTGDFVYAVNSGTTADISQYAASPVDGTLTALGTPSVAAGSDARDLVADGNGTFLYVANRGDDTLGLYAIDALTGQLGPLSPATVSTGDGPNALALDAGANKLYACNLFADEVDEFDIEADGSLTFVAAVRTRSNPNDIALGPDQSILSFTSDFAYVSNRSDTAPSVSQFAVDTAGGISLSSLTPASVDVTGPNPRGLALNRDQDLMVATSDSGSPFTLFTRDTATGALSAAATFPDMNSWDAEFDLSGRFLVVNLRPLGLTPYAVDAVTPGLTAMTSAPGGADPRDLAMDPTGQFVYLAETTTGVRGYRINASTGDLTFLGTVAGGGTTASVVVHPSGRFAYATNLAGDSISMYRINSVTGALSSLAPGTVSTGAGTGPVGIASDRHGNNLYVTLSSTGEVTQFQVDRITGLLTAGVTAPTFEMQPQSLAVSASGRYLVCTNSVSSGVVTLFDIDTATGAISNAGFASAQVNTTGVILTTDPQ